MSVPQSSPGTPSVLEGLACDSPASSVVYLIEDSLEYDSDPFCIGPGVWRRTPHVRAVPILANPLDTDAAVDTDPFCVTPDFLQPSLSSARSSGASTEEIVSALPIEPAQQSSTVVSARSEIVAARDAFFTEQRRERGRRERERRERERIGLLHSATRHRSRSLPRGPRRRQAQTTIDPDSLIWRRDEALTQITIKTQEAVHEAGVPVYFAFKYDAHACARAMLDLIESCDVWTKESVDPCCASELYDAWTTTDSVDPCASHGSSEFYVGATTNPLRRWCGAGDMPGHSRRFARMVLLAFANFDVTYELETYLISIALDAYPRRCVNKARDARGQTAAPNFIYIVSALS